MRQSLTLLQRAVIDRLRQAGYNSLADAAKNAWSHGGPVLGLPNVVSERHAALRADYERADAQAMDVA